MLVRKKHFDNLWAIIMKTKQNHSLLLNSTMSSETSVKESQSSQLKRLTRMLRHVDDVNGRLFDVRDDTIILDGEAKNKMIEFKNLARAAIGNKANQRALRERNVSCFLTRDERRQVTLSLLPQVVSFLKLTPQQLKTIRTVVSSQVTQRRMWVNSLLDILRDLEPELVYLNSVSPTKGTNMGQQIVTNCLAILTNAANIYETKSATWMTPFLPHKRRALSLYSSPSKKIETWRDMLNMFIDLIECLKNEDKLIYHAVKILAMKDGMYQIQDCVFDSDMNFKEVKNQDWFVRKRLSQNLGPKSPCLFTLLLYYLFGQVRDIEIDLCGGHYNGRGISGPRVCIGKVLTSGDETMVLRGVKQVDRTLGLFKFLMEIVGVKGAMDLQGHLWCVGAQPKTLDYNGKKFFLHDIKLSET